MSSVLHLEADCHYVSTAVSAPRSICSAHNPRITVAQGISAFEVVQGCIIAVQVRQVAADPRPSSEDD